MNQLLTNQKYHQFENIFPSPMFLSGNLSSKKSIQFFECRMNLSNSNSSPSMLLFRVKSGAYSFFSYKSSQLMFSNHGLFFSDANVGPPSRESGSFLFSSWSISFLAFLSLREREYLSSRLRISS